MPGALAGAEDLLEGEEELAGRGLVGVVAGAQAEGLLAGAAQDAAEGLVHVGEIQGQVDFVVALLDALEDVAVLLVVPAERGLGLAELPVQIVARALGHAVGSGLACGGRR